MLWKRKTVRNREIRAIPEYCLEDNLHTEVWFDTAFYWRIVVFSLEVALRIWTADLLDHKYEEFFDYKH